jgi:hypothetical protein
MAKSFTEKFYEFPEDPDGLIWLVKDPIKTPRPYCNKHRVRLVPEPMSFNFPKDLILVCPQDSEQFRTLHGLRIAANLVSQKVFNTRLRDLKVVRIDPDGYQVLAKETVAKNPLYWIDAKLSNTSRGLQLMIQAGKKNKKGEKVQLFVEPAAKRMDFDRNGKDIHPNGVFAIVTAEFKESTTTISDKTSLDEAITV